MNATRSLSVDEARAAIQAAIHPPDGTETLPLKEALGRVLAGNIVSPIDVPSCDNSAMDGWALMAADTEGAGANRSFI